LGVSLALRVNFGEVEACAMGANVADKANALMRTIRIFMI
jgi:hypothetical protein